MNADATTPKKKGFPWMRLQLQIVCRAIVLWQKRHPRIKLLSQIVGFAILLSGLVRVGRAVLEQMKGYRTEVDAIILRVALENFITEFGTPPDGDHAEVIAALRGKNAREIDFLPLRSHRFNAQGELPDQWGHPFHIDVSDPKAPTVYSFGKNGIDEGGAKGSDDVASWR